MKGRQTGSVMVAVQALDRSSNALLRKASKLARARKCNLDLVHVIALPYAPAVSRRAALRQAAQEIVDDCRKRLLKLAASPLLRGIRTRATVTWDYPAAAGLVRQVSKRRPQLLLVESHRHSRLARPFLSNTDWELIRNCPCPVWLSKPSRTRLDGPVIAAVDPLHAHAKPAALDRVILERALQVAGRPQRVLMCHAYDFPTRPPVIDGAIEAYWILSEQEVERYEAMLHDELRRLADGTGIPERNRIVAAGDPAFVLPRLVRKHRAAVVVMGAVSRSAVRRLFIGHTAERLVDRLDCDVLVVKPRGFKTAVMARPRMIVNLPPLEISP
jgi:universal stress protein E